MRRYSKTSKAVILALMSVMSLTSPALAAGPGDGEELVSVSLVVFFGSLGVGVSTGGLIGYISGSSVAQGTGKAKAIAQLEHRQRLLEAYLQRDSGGLEAELALGAGGHVYDVAALCGVQQEEVGEFGRRLRAQRAPLGALMRHPQAFTPAQIWAKLCV